MQKNHIKQALSGTPKVQEKVQERGKLLAEIEHLQRHKKTGRLSYRRQIPPELRPYIPGRPGLLELKRSLGAKSIAGRGAMDRYRAAEEEFARLIDAARKGAELDRKLTSGKFDTLDSETIARLIKVFEYDWHETDEKALKARGGEWVEKARHFWEWKLDDFREMRLEQDHELMVEEWSSSAHSLLRSAGLAIDPEETATMEALCSAINDAVIGLSTPSKARLSGDIVALPPVPSLPTPQGREDTRSPSLSAAATFEDIAEDILDHSIPPVGNSTKEAARTALRFLRETHGTLRPSQITRSLGTDFVRLLAQRPARLPAAERGLPLPVIAARYADRPDVPRLSQKTLAQHTGQLAALWTKAQAEDGHIPEGLPNPFGRRKFQIEAPPEEPQALSPEELKAIFALPIFTAGERPGGGKGDASYWIPLLLLWTGARPEEIAQLMVSDVAQDADGRWTLRITDEGIHPHKGQRTLKTTKKGTGRRTFLIPQALLDLNFIAYVGAVRKQGEAALFPDLRTKGKRNLLFAGWSDWWSKYVQASKILPTGQGRRASREFRHNWIEAARKSGVPEDAREYLAGHGSAGKSANHGYGSRASFGAFMDRVAYEGLDLSAVKPWKAQKG